MTNARLEKLIKNVQKPGRYTGGEQGSIIKNKEDVNIRFAFCFPDTYEIGMSFLGMKILYGLYNSIPDVWCERVFAPCDDMEEAMRNLGEPLFALESRDPISDFDFVGFTLQYELSYTNILNMLQLGGIPLLSKDRKEGDPIILGGGPCACNPEPIADFFDVFSLGESEEISVEMFDVYRECKKQGMSRAEIIKELSKIEGIYVPSMYDVEYNDDGTVKAVTPKEGAPAVVSKRIVKELDNMYYPSEFVVPFINTVFDRATIEVFRGCMRGCRFCQAGYIYRPKREKSHELLDRQAYDLCRSSGYEELSMLSLSTSDYTELPQLLDDLIPWTSEKKINLALPSLRVDNFSKELSEKISAVRKSSVTFAAEAGTQRMRDVINKNVTEEEVLRSCKMAFEGGHSTVKLYFMIGLPTETDEDVIGIAELANKVLDTYFNLPVRPNGRNVSINIGVSSLVPKPHTPFQWIPQNDPETLHRKQQLIVDHLKSKKIKFGWHDTKTSYLEGAMARGDRRISRVILNAFNMGCKFDGWNEHFKFDCWNKAFEMAGLSMQEYSSRERRPDEVLPWDHIFFGVTKDFLKREWEKAKRAEITPDCSKGCAGCGASKWGEGICFERD